MWPPKVDETVAWLTVSTDWRGRLRPLLISPEAREFYLYARSNMASTRFGDFAKIGIGYISGDNDFFHLSPSEARLHEIPFEFLVPSVRRGRSLDGEAIDENTIKRWHAADEAFYLLSLPSSGVLPEAITRYLATERGAETSKRYKCRTRRVWYSVPGVSRPDYFLQYMSGVDVKLARNDAGASCTNSLHAVQVINHAAAARAFANWGSNLTKLSCELEGHPLGGGMLKLEPREATRIVFAEGIAEPSPHVVIEALATLKAWRHQSKIAQTVHDEN